MSLLAFLFLPGGDRTSTRTDQGGYMGVPEILTIIDQEIAQLQQAKALLTGGVAPVAKKKAGRPQR